MSRLSLIMGLFMAASITSVVLLLAIINGVSPGTIIYRVCVIFFIFGTLGTILGSFLEVIMLPVSTKKESEKLEVELSFDADELKAELGDLLDKKELSIREKIETNGTLADETLNHKGKDSFTGRISSDNSAIVS